MARISIERKTTITIVLSEQEAIALRMIVQDSKEHNEHFINAEDTPDKKELREYIARTIKI